jgi:hypothetical protein
MLIQDIYYQVLLVRVIRLQLLSDLQQCLQTTLAREESAMPFQDAQVLRQDHQMYLLADKTSKYLIDFQQNWH